MSEPTQSTPGSAPVVAAEPKRSGFQVVQSAIGQGGLLMVLLAFVLFFQITTNGVMLKSLNVTNVFLQNGYILVMALGMLLIIVIGHIDLSVGSVAGFLGAIVAVLMVGVTVPVLGKVQLDPLLAVALTLIAGGLIGVWQGIWVAYLRVPSFIVTLAGMLLFRGATLFMLGGQPVGPFPESFRAISSGFIPEIIGTIPDPFGTATPPIKLLGIVMPVGGDPLQLTTLLLGAILSGFLVFLAFRARREQVKYGFAVPSIAQFWLRNALIIFGIMFIAYRLAGYKGLPIVALIAFILIGIYMFVTLRTTLGRRIYAVGGNAKAAMLSGVNAKWMVFLTFINMGVLAALGGMIIAARFNSATPKAGYGFELDVIAATFVGGASAYGGVGTVAGTVIGAVFFGLLNIGMGVMSIPIDYQFMFKALVLLFAVYFDVRGKTRDA
ncbi:MAG TPA: multiple monosaccharide ABC transporter permease [Candidatus Limnocylindrales bacterium]|nr:multiple monosaccharide ABC transporter permease [Candidatus Limnocylindrales bacterium]